MGEGDVGQMMNKITAIEAFPDRRTLTFSAKPIINNTDIPRKICTTCKFRGHLAPECWGRCSHCKRFGHKSEVCRLKPQIPATEPVVKKNEGTRRKSKNKKKKAKTIKELTELVETLKLNSPNISEYESSESDSNITQSINRVQVKSPQADRNSRRDRRSTTYTGISDHKVINTLNRTKIATINKVKKTKSKGMSHADGLVSNTLNFRSVRTERLLLDFVYRSYFCSI